MNKKSLIACSILFTMSATTNEEFAQPFKIAKVGEWKGHSEGEFRLTLEDLKQIKTNFDNSQIDTVIDLDHSTYWGGGEAYGWIKALDIEDDSLVVTQIEWLESALELLKGKRYKYISPVLERNTIDSVTGENIGWTLHSAALTNRPFLEDLGEIIVNSKSNTAKENEDLKALEDENKKLKEQIEKSQNEKIETQVTSAIAANKVRPEQKDSLIAMAKADYASFEDFLLKAKPLVEAPPKDMFKNHKTNPHTGLTEAELNA